MTSTTTVVSSQRVSNLQVRGFYSNKRISLPPVYMRDFIPANRTHIPTNETAEVWAHLVHLQSEIAPLQDCEVGLLIGYDCSQALLPREVVSGKENEPYAQRTDLGWSIVGNRNPCVDYGDAIGISHRIAVRQVIPDVESSVNLKRVVHYVSQTKVKEVTPSDIIRVLELDFSERTGDDIVSQDDLKFLTKLRENIVQNDTFLWQKELPGRQCKVGEIKEDDPELRKVIVCNTKSKEDRSLLDNFKKFSDWSRLSRAVARLKRYIRIHKGQKTITVKSGQDVTLTCLAPNNNILAVKWSRSDLEDKHVLLYQDGQFDSNNQHPSFKNRVDLQDRQMKDGDVSLILKDVTINDAGTYVCRVFMRGRLSQKLIYLRVLPPDEFITAESGQDVTLTCLAPKNNITGVVWIRGDLKPGYVLLYQDGQFDPLYQHPSFKNRVDLQDRQMKDGDVSLILKDVTIKDTGAYVCAVFMKETDSLEPINITHLIVDPDLKNITVKSGQNVTLTCLAPNNKITAVLWGRGGLKSENVFLYEDGHFVPDNQHPSFKSRVDLLDRQMKDGNVSLILKDVTINDAGTYVCSVFMRGSFSLKLNFIKLTVLPPDELIKIESGQDVTLTCQAPNNNITGVVWIRSDLGDEYVFLYQDHPDPANQHPSFKNRVDLQDRQMKDGDVSLSLKDVTIKDTGTYVCSVLLEETRSLKLISIINLIVFDRPDLKIIPAESGQDVTLTCRAPNNNIKHLNWRRADLESEHVLLYEDGHFVPDNQHPSFKNRVDLLDRQMKDGDVSLILKNVTINDTGTYECRVSVGGRLSWKLNSIVYLSISPGQKTIAVKSGQDVTLTCLAPNNKITILKWSKADLEDKHVLLYQDGRFDPANKHPSFKNRVDLQDRQMKDGDVSLILKNVTINDAGTYECRVYMEETDSLKLSFIYLHVVPPDPKILKADSGQNVTLTCRAPANKIRVVKWSRADLKSEHVLSYWNGQFFPIFQHPSFKNRVDLQDRQMKNGDVSLILKDVTIKDTGAYVCHVSVAEKPSLERVNTVYLIVFDRPGE
ncbi:unnamed protein product [Oreochromis niloticus]|nr:unnamed protein product [Mustela putorius furo]